MTIVRLLPCALRSWIDRRRQQRAGPVVSDVSPLVILGSMVLPALFVAIPAVVGEPFGPPGNPDRVGSLADIHRDDTEACARDFDSGERVPTAVTA